MIIIVMLGVFNFWDFPIDDIYVWRFPVHPIINIVLKSILITVVYLFLIFKLNISTELDNLLKKYYK